MKYIIDLCVIYDASTCYLQLIDNHESSIRISNPASRLLIEMLTHPNVPLKREVLIQKVWEEYGFTGSSISLNVAVSEIRKAFKLLGRETPPIKTIAKVGFCFTALVEIHSLPLVEEIPSQTPLPTETFPSPRRNNALKRLRLSPTVIIIGLLSTLLMMAMFYPIEFPKQLQQELIALGKQDNCTLYSLDAEKHIDNEAEKRMAGKILQLSNVDCKKISADVYFSMRRHTLSYDTFLGVCYLGNEHQYTQCVTYKILNGK
ncbi:transcriptional regulator [Serratia marcescens]|jgi:DNA-binding winged helix-turn-helix (wHTH) protein|uniref:winged helix-turn-helix domain-containing protein n=1 Tax=Serratia surfactantfaciens TaxID=2741499 RepID=UPI000363F696|nr:winged helix-turn-helix domain-containing protein [Serratia surfactantfaciens]BEM86654.1 transcriptional regulator [Serratia marcescens]BEO60695.1 transcriptional regulator [Serratia marcescens]